MRGSSGNSLLEMVVVLAILSLLATTAAPYAIKTIRRDKEIQLRETLRTVRTAIDQFHVDVQGVPAEKRTGMNCSANGYPVSLQTLVDGIERPTEGGKTKRKRYLRSLPVNPLVPAGAPQEAQWTFVSSQTESAPVVASSSYGTTLAEVQTVKKDVYDLHPKTAGIALDGSKYADW